jgi:putative PIN family toxin of toxin-antitoxin system
MSEPTKARFRLVLDTNTVMALWLFRDPGLGALAALTAAADCALFSRADALEELRRVLAYRQFDASRERQAALLEAYRERVECLPASPAVDGDALPACRDADDQKFLEIARAAGASHLLSRDKALLRLARHRLLRGRFRILTPERFVAELAAQVTS